MVLTTRRRGSDKLLLIMMHQVEMFSHGNKLSDTDENREIADPG